LNSAKQFGNNTNVPLTINSGATLSTSGSNLGLTFHGHFINNGTLSAGSSAVTITGTVAAQNIGRFTTSGAVSVTKTSGTATFTGNFTTTGNLSIASGAVALLGNQSKSNAGTLILGGVTQNAAGSWGGTLSPAINKNATYFGSTTTGILNGAPGGGTNCTWTGITSTAWTTGTNWDATPTSGDNVYIPAAATNDPALASAVTLGTVEVEGGAALSLTSTGSITANSLTNAGTLTINGGGIVSLSGALTLNTGSTVTVKSSSATDNGVLKFGSIAGTSQNVTYERWVTGGSTVDKWHMISAPVYGELISSFITTNAIAINPAGTKYALGPYDEILHKWIYYYTPTHGGVDMPYPPTTAFPMGTGYQVLRSADGILSFTGVPVASQSVGITRTTQTDPGWNLIGNPFTAYLDASAFLTTNSTQIDDSFDAVYYWDPATSTSSYLVLNSLSIDPTLAPGQGFFVKAASSSTVNFTPTMSAASGRSFKSTRSSASVSLAVQSAGASQKAQINYIQGMTRGLDRGYDAGMFDQGGALAVYTRLVDDNNVNFFLQCLPDNDYENMVVPVGLRAPQGAEVIFRAETANLPTGYKLYLEDRLAAKFTRIDESGSSYTITLAQASTGTGRFFLHTKQGALGIPETITGELKIVAIPDQETIRITGHVSLPATVTVCDLSGKMLLSSRLQGASENEVLFAGQKNGIYLVQVQSAAANTKEKITWFK
jgi:hypothetical protein